MWLTATVPDISNGLVPIFLDPSIPKFAAGVSISAVRLYKVEISQIGEQRESDKNATAGNNQEYGELENDAFFVPYAPESNENVAPETTPVLKHVVAVSAFLVVVNLVLSHRHGIEWSRAKFDHVVVSERKCVIECPIFTTKHMSRRQQYIFWVILVVNMFIPEQHVHQNLCRFIASVSQHSPKVSTWMSWKSQTFRLTTW